MERRPAASQSSIELSRTLNLVPFGFSFKHEMNILSVSSTENPTGVDGTGCPAHCSSSGKCGLCSYRQAFPEPPFARNGRVMVQELLSAAIGLHPRRFELVIISKGPEGRQRPQDTPRPRTALLWRRNKLGPIGSAPRSWAARPCRRCRQD